MQDTPETPAKKIRFDGTINLGHILTFLGFIATGIAVYSNMDKRLVILEENRKYQSVVDHAQDIRANTASEEMKSLLLRVERQVERLNDRLDRKDGLKQTQP